MIRIFVIFLLTCCFSKTYSQTENNKFSFSVRYLGAGDITVQTPDGGKPNRNSTMSIIPGIDANFEIPVKNNLWFSTGYRWKEKWGAVSTSIIAGDTYLGYLHSVYAKLVWRKSILQSLLPNRLSFDIGGGLMGSKIVENGGGRFTFSATTLSTGTTTYSGFENWNAAHNAPKFTASLDGLANINCRVYKNLYLSAGYGFNYGLRNLNQGFYSVSGSGGLSTSGTLATKGTYVYLLTGLSLKF